MRHAAVMPANASIGYAGSILFFTTSFGIGIATAEGALARRVMDQSKDSQSEVQTHQTHQLRLFHFCS
jgi:hypothetical protein